MIKTFQATSGFMAQLPSLKDGRIMQFTTGLNIIFGDSGTGKSCVAKALAGYCGIETGGWSKISNPAKLATRANLKGQFPIVYRAYANQCDCKVEWDGTPTFYNDADVVSRNDTTWFFSNQSMSKDGITSESEQMDIMATKPSAGQFRKHKINKIMQLLKNIPSLSVIPTDILDRAVAQEEVNYINSLPRNGKSTVIFDEPEKGLNFSAQIELFKVLEQLAQHFQVIVVTHFPFVVFNKNANIIEMEKGYTKMVKALIKKEVKA